VCDRRGPKVGSEVGCLDGAPGAGRRAIGVERGVVGSLLVAEGNDAGLKDSHWAPALVARARQADEFTFDAVLLAVKFQGHLRDSVPLLLGCGTPAQSLIMDVEMGMANAEWCSVRAAGVGIFPWPEKEVEGQEEHIGNGGVFRCPSIDAKFGGMYDDGQRDGFLAVGARVVFGVCGELPGEAEVETAGGIEAWIPLPQAGERLSHGSKGRFHCSSTDKTTCGSQVSCTVLSGKKL
jgi:hypothetical protein